METQGVARGWKIAAIVASAVALLLLANCAVIGVALVGSDGNALAAVQAYLDGRTRQVAPPARVIAPPYVPPVQPPPVDPRSRYRPPSSPTYTPARPPSPCAPLPTARAQFACGLIDGVVYCAGGYQKTPPYMLDTVEAYDVAANTWRTGLAPLPVPLCGLAGAVWQGKLYAFSGMDGSSEQNGAYAYDPAADAWQTLAPIPGVASDAGVAVVGDAIYLLGGTMASGTSAVFVYHPRQDSWETLPLPAQVRARRIAPAVAVGTDIYWIGGRDGVIDKFNDEVDIFDTVHRTWRQGTPLPEGRSGLQAVLHNGSILVLGGLSRKPDTPQGVLVEPREALRGSGRGAWQQAGKIAIYRNHFGIVVTDDGRILLIGGLEINANAYDSVEEYGYGPAQNWQAPPRPDHPSARNAGRQSGV